MLSNNSFKNIFEQDSSKNNSILQRERYKAFRRLKPSTFSQQTWCQISQCLRGHDTVEEVTERALTIQLEQDNKQSKSESSDLPKHAYLPHPAETWPELRDRPRTWQHPKGWIQS